MALFIVISSKTISFVTDFAIFALFVFAKKEKKLELFTLAGIASPGMCLAI